MQRNTVTNRFLPIPESVQLGLEKEAKIDDFEKIKLIGGGNFGKVHLARHKATNVIYAIKEIDKTNKNNQSGSPYFRREIEIMYKIRHPYIVRLYGHFEDENSIYFVMEYLSNGNLYQLIQKNKPNGIPKNTAVKLMTEVLSAVYFLHNMNPPIIHRDIKPENILITEDGTAKLTDFGWSNYITNEEERRTLCGSPVYLSPEIIKRDSQNEKVDIWCLGVLLFEVITGNLPFKFKNLEELYSNIYKVNITWPGSIEPEVKNLIPKLLKFDPNKRIPIPEILNQHYFKSVLPKAAKSLIKPDENMTHRVYIISKDTPEEESKLLEDIKNKGYLIDLSQFKGNEYLSLIYYQKNELSKVISSLKLKISDLEKNITNTKKENNNFSDDSSDEDGAEDVSDNLSELEKEHSILKEQLEKYEKMLKNQELNSNLEMKIYNLKDSIKDEKEKIIEEIKAFKSEVNEESKIILNSFLEKKENNSMEKIEEFINRAEEEVLKFNRKIESLIKDL